MISGVTFIALMSCNACWTSAQLAMPADEGELPRTGSRMICTCAVTSPARRVGWDRNQSELAVPAYRSRFSPNSSGEAGVVAPAPALALSTVSTAPDSSASANRIAAGTRARRPGGKGRGGSGGIGVPLLLGEFTGDR